MNNSGNFFYHHFCFLPNVCSLHLHPLPTLLPHPHPHPLLLHPLHLHLLTLLPLPPPLLLPTSKCVNTTKDAAGVKMRNCTQARLGSTTVGASSPHYEPSTLIKK